MRRRLLPTLLLLAVLAGCGASGDEVYTAADLHTGEITSVSDLEGAPALLVSWATWCRECDEELAALQTFAESPDAEGVGIVAVNLDAADVDDEINDKLDRHGLTTDLWRDRRNDFRRSYGALGVPTTVVLDGEGAVVGTFPGGVAGDDSAVLAALARASDRTAVEAPASTLGGGVLLVSLAVAFAAGIVSFLSPCVLPLVPAHLSLVTGLSAADLATPAPVPVPAGAPPPPDTAPDTVTSRRAVRRRVIVGTLGFVLGTAVVFVSFGALFGSFGEALRTHAVTLSRVFGVVTILLGLLLAGALEWLTPLQRDVRIHRLPGKGLAAAPILGFTFALGWTPCIGPTLGAVLALSASTDGATAARGALLAVAYCLGLGIPLLVTGLAFTRAMSAFAVVKRHYRAFMLAGGLSLVLLGVLQVTGVWNTWMNALQATFGGASLPL